MKRTILQVAASLLVCAGPLHATNTSNLPTGYYTIKSATTNTSITHVYAFNDAASTTVSSNSMKASERTLLSTTLGTTNNYYWRIVNSGGNTVTIVNGQGTPIVREDGNHGASGVAKLSTLTPVDANSTYTTAVYFSEGLCAPGASDTNHQYGDYTAINLYANHVGDNTKWNLTRSEEGKTFYTVSVTGNTNGYITRTATSERAYNTGFFVFDADATAPTASDFTAAAIDGYGAQISVDATAHTITVTYSYNAEFLRNDIATAQAVLDKTGVGYPKANSTARTTFKQAIASAQQTLDEVGEASSSTTFSTAVATLNAAINTYKQATDIQMPEDGHTYVFTNVHPQSGRKYYNYASSGCTMVARGDGDAESLPQSAKFTCRVVGDKYVFVNNEGKFLSWRYKTPKSGVTGTNGFTDSYVAATNGMTFAKMQFTSYTTSATSLADLFGYVSFGGLKTDGSSSTASSFFVVKNDGTFDRADLNNWYYNTTYSNAFQVEEVTYPNTITFNAAEGIDGVEQIATFSAPFATVVPQGVTAWYVDQVNTAAHLQSIETGKAIPAGQGVLLTAPQGTTSAIMLPALTETAATIASNGLGASAGAALTLTDDTHAYILTRDTENNCTAFCRGRIGSVLKMNKAYLKLASGGSAQSFMMNFGGISTGISQIEAQGSFEAPIYDLTGRRVVRPVKGSLYIQGGKKFIAQ